MLRKSGKEAGEKKFRRFTRRNPLKSLGSDERIQGNPTLISQAFAAKRPLAKKTQTDLLGQCRRLKILIHTV
jgi:hypothetical protein